MRLLLDTHTFLWWDAASVKLSPHALALCQDRSNDLILSMVSLWEIQIKVGIGKLTLSAPLRQIVATHQTRGLQLLPVTPEHIFQLETLPPHHKDPFDRLLIAQAITENLTLLSVDQAFAAYPVACVRFSFSALVSH